MINRSIVGLSIMEPFLFSPFTFLTPYLYGSTIVENVKCDKMQPPRETEVRCNSVSRTRNGGTHDSLHLQNESNGRIPCDCDMQDFKLPRLRHLIIAPQSSQSSLPYALWQKGISRLHWRHRRHGVTKYPSVWRHLRRFLCLWLATNTTGLSS